MNPSLLLIPDRYKAAKLYSQIPDSGAGDLTFARNSNATRVNSAGLIEKVRTNLFPNGSNLSSTGWTTSNATLTAGQADPNGGTTAMRIQFAGLAGFAYYALSGTDQPYNRSLFIKAASNQSIKIGEIFGGTSIVINVTTSYQRFDISALNFISGSFGIDINNQNDNAAKDITIAFVQIEAGDIATDYIPTTTAAVSVGITADIPRLDYTGAGCPSLLLEPQRTNLALYSEQFDDASNWALTNATITANNAVSPDGFVNADTVTITGGGNAINGVATSTGSNTITYSVFAKAGSANAFRIREANYFGTSTIFNLSAGTVTSGTGTITNYGNGWYRCTHTQAYGVGETTVSVVFDTTSASGTFSLYGAQFEVGSYATSYIPTLGSSVTRLADAASKGSISSLVNNSAGTLYFEVLFDKLYDAGGSGPSGLEIGDGGNFANIISIGVVRGVPNQIFVFNRNASTNVIRNSINITSVGIYKCAFSYDANGNSFYVNGALVSNYATGNSSTAAIVNSFSRLTLGGFWNGSTAGSLNNDGIISAAIYPTRLSNSELATLTSL
jgi:hypothetical protein